MHPPAGTEDAVLILSPNITLSRRRGRGGIPIQHSRARHVRRLARLEWKARWSMDKKATLAFAFLLLTLRAGSQNSTNPQPEAQCKFSDGNKITVTYFPERRSYRLSTNEPVITVGVTVPAGDYTLVRGWERGGHFLMLERDGHFLRLQKEPGASTLSLQQKKDAVSFISTGRSCTMQLASEKSNTLFSLEFTEKNTDL